MDCSMEYKILPNRIYRFLMYFSFRIMSWYYPQYIYSGILFGALAEMCGWWGFDDGT
jgi:hypothetical protein